MGKLKIKQEIIEEGIKIFNEKKSYIKEFSSVHDLVNFDLDGNSMDGRDFMDIGLLLPITGETPEKRKKNFQKEYRNMLKAFAGGKTKEREKYLDMLFDNYAKAQDYYKDGVNTAEDFVTCAGISALGQCVAVKRNENLNWYYKKYNDQKKFAKFYNSTMVQDALASDILKVSKDYPTFKPKGVNDIDFYAEQSGMDMMRVLADGVAKANEDGTPDIIPFKMPGRIKNDNNVANYKKLNADYFIGEKMLADSGIRKMMQKMTKIKEIEPEEFDSRRFTFIGDKSLLDLANETLRKTKEYKDPNKEISGRDLAKMSVTLFNKAMTSGDQVVSFVTPAMKDGEIELSVKKLKPDVSAIKESILSEHSWFRRTFFNWGPFKIATPDQKKIDKVYREAGNSLDKTILEQAKADLDDAIYDQTIKNTQKAVAFKETEQYQNMLNTRAANKEKAQSFINECEIRDKEEISFFKDLQVDVEMTEREKQVAPKVENNEVNKTIKKENVIE